MDPLTPLLNQIAPSVGYYFSGVTCEGGGYNGTDPHGHLHVMRSGQLRLDLPNNQQIRVDVPSVVLFPRPCAHQLIPQCTVDIICGTLDLGILEQSPLVTALPEYVVIPLAEMPSVLTILDLICQESSAEKAGRQAAINCLLEYFVIHVIRYLFSRNQFSVGLLAVMNDIRLSKAVKAMHENPAHSWTLEQLAEVANLSRSRFAANFHRLAGITPLEYLTNWRLSIARNLLRQGKNLKTVASTVGYQSPEAFGRVFLKKMGMTPTQWSRRLTLMI
ncbi:AraC family transcriptional regulator [Aquaspirillum soli]